MRPRRAQHGFTLIELIVATTIMSITFTALYFVFNTSIRAGRRGEADMTTYQQTRYALDLFERDLQCLVPGTEHLFVGDGDEVEFFTISAPLDVEVHEGSCVLWVRYALDKGDNGARVLVREEAIVESPLPAASADSDEIEAFRVNLGKRETFPLVDAALDFELRYLWYPDIHPPEPDVRIIELSRNEEEWGVPQAIGVELTVVDDFAETGRITFSNTIAFRANSSRYDEERITGRGT